MKKTDSNYRVCLKANKGYSLLKRLVKNDGCPCCKKQFEEHYEELWVRLKDVQEFHVRYEDVGADDGGDDPNWMGTAVEDGKIIFGWHTK